MSRETARLNDCRVLDSDLRRLLIRDAKARRKLVRMLAAQFMRTTTKGELAMLAAKAHVDRLTQERP